MWNKSKLAVCIAAGAVAAGVVLSTLHAQQEQAPPAQPPAAQQPAGQQQDQAAQPGQRSHEQIIQDLQQTSEQLQGAISSPEVMTDPQQRAEAAPNVVPPLKRMLELAEELAATPAGASFRAKDMANNFRTMLALFGDKEAIANLEQQTSSEDAGEALNAKISLNVVRWLDKKDAEAQTKVLDELETLAKENPKSDELTMTLFQLSQEGGANQELGRRAENIISGMESQSAAQIKEHFAAEGKMRDMEGKPITLQGVTVDGKQFSTEQLKGKVVLVDFWATWCGPCIAELPRLKKVYEQYKDKGLEIVGISSDQQASDLQEFLKQHHDMSWPQLFDASNPGQHALAKQYGVDSIPRYWLIDKNGVLRDADARADYEKQIPELLAEGSE